MRESMGTYLVAILSIFCVALLGIVVDRAYLLFSRHNPQLGPFRKNDGGCGCCAAKDACDSRSGSCRS